MDKATADRLSTGRARKEVSGMTTLNPTDLSESSLVLNKNQFIAYENTKQINNNPLKDISNRVVN